MDINDSNDNFLSLLLSKIFMENKIVSLIGDFNINLLKTNVFNSHAHFLDLLGSYHLLPHIFLPTRITDNSNTLKDNIFLSSNPYQSISGNLVIGLSDHLP